MQAARIHAFGPPDVIRIEDINLPEFRDGDLLVRVFASGINPIEWKIRSGAMTQALQRPLPVTLGWECAGIVEAVGTGVTSFEVGDAVFAYPEFARGGTHAGYVAIAADQAAAKPAKLNFTAAAAVPMTAQAAWTAIEMAGLAAGQRVLIHGAAGAVGHWLVQLANSKGAAVVGTASGEGLQRIVALGVDAAVDYRTDKFENHGIFDVIFDLVGGETQERSWAVLGEGGRLVSTVSPPAPERGDKNGSFVFTPPRGDVLAQIAAMIDTGALTSLPVDRCIGLADLPLVHADAERGALGGKVIINIDTPKEKLND